MSRTQEVELRARTKNFALRIIRLYAALPKTTEAQVIGNALGYKTVSDLQVGQLLAVVLQPQPFSTHERLADNFFALGHRLAHITAKHNALNRMRISSTKSKGHCKNWTKQRTG